MTKLQELINGTPIFYQDYNGEHDYKEYFLRPRELYQEAREELKSWLKDVLTREIKTDGKYAGTSATIYLPMRDLTVEVLSAGPVRIELFHTPIGVIDRYTYDAIREEEGNPVKELLDFLYKTYNDWKSQLSYATREDEFSLVTKELMGLWGWKDPLELYRIFPMMYGYDEFISGKMYSE